MILIGFCSLLSLNVGQGDGPNQSGAMPRYLTLHDQHCHKMYRQDMGTLTLYQIALSKHNKPL